MPILFLIFVIYPVLIIESIATIIMTKAKKFESSRLAHRFNILTSLAFLVGIIAIVISPRVHDVSIQLIIGLLFCSVTSMFLPNMQARAAIKHNKKKQGDAKTRSF